MTSKTRESVSNAKVHLELKNAPAETVCLDPRHRIAWEYRIGGDPDEITVQPNVAPSLYNMVLSGTVGSMSQNSAYQYPDLGDDDEAHEHPDYEKLNKLDIVDKNNFVDIWLENPNNYEKQPEQKSEASNEESEQKAAAPGAGA